MIKQIKSLKPEELWLNFYQLTQIPRPSKFEKKITDHIINLVRLKNLEFQTDKSGNLIVRKPATTGYENKEVVILQAHLDMVGQKLPESKHNFETDSIDAFIDGQWVMAKQTTLGADNGIGVAAILSVLESSHIEHGPIEALFTVSEEIGMIGALGLEPKLLEGKILINLDTEEEGKLYVGCAGSADSKIVFNYQNTNPPAGYIAKKVSIKNLKGGHSGLDIHLKRGNANKMLNRILINANQHLGLIVSSISGGTLRNVIPSEAEAIIAIPENEFENLIKFVKEIENYCKKSLTDEAEFSITLEECEMPQNFIDFETLDNFLNAVHLAPNGVIKMSKKLKGVVETSTNMATIKSENNEIQVNFFHRSLSESAKANLINQIEELFIKYGAKIYKTGNSPGWKPNHDSIILKIMKEVYEETFGRMPVVKVIHAGLECGVIFSVYPQLDMISIGPTIKNAHTPSEKVNIKSVEKFYKFLLATLKNVPDRKK